MEVFRGGDGYGGYGLSLLVTPRKSGGFSKTWAQAISPNGAKTSLGLGSYPVVTLAMAREKALANARALAEGRDRRRRMQRVPTFAQANETVSCGGRGVSLDIWPAPAFRHPPRRALSVFPDTTGTAPRPARHVAPRPGSRHARLFARQARGPSRAGGRKRLAGSGAADGVPEGGAAAPHRRHHGANDMDSQTIERAIKRCIEISVHLGALEDEAPPRPAASSSSAWTTSTKCSDGSKAASELARGWPGGRFGPRRGHKHPGSGSRRSERSTMTAPSAAP